MFLHESNQSRKLEAAVMGACVWMLVTDKKKHTSNKHFNRRNENGGCVIGGVPSFDIYMPVIIIGQITRNMKL